MQYCEKKSDCAYFVEDNECVVPCSQVCFKPKTESTKTSRPIGSDQTPYSATDVERLNWLIDRCYFPDDHPNDQVLLIIPKEWLADGDYTGRKENDRKTVRHVIDLAMKK